ncbi:YdcF family protein [Roseibium denhamense]|uniref:Uncharacterized SAM-binding protein YcdF, DUF218 family n=1 Tax=Roseibium denhamense TaxID=76305 RepID=A0ABY1PAN3_9HYPH|nr:YdcF family protein [Roseibium denhamense]MTI07527.1 YdcF family protein [Roseibium denhamense]SMP30249.1 Uncharacterized SAM-binding protein YcdF, DUF218 family [Roseibium denhamense]
MTNADTAIEQGLEAGRTLPPESSSNVSAGTVPNGPSFAPKAKRRFGLRVALIAGLTALAAGSAVEFTRFAQSVAGTAAPSEATADAIVVLTGGQARVAQGVRLMEQGHGSRLLISGVHPGTTRKQLAVVTESDMPLEETTVDLDRTALNTAGNATETAAWVKKNGFKSLLVVTSAYHMPRATAELSIALPDVDLIGYPVITEHLQLKNWYREPATFRLLMREYVKYIVARLRIAIQGLG